MSHRILAYHRIADETPPGIENWAVRPAVFHRQMWLLKRLGYRGVSVRDLLDATDGGGGGEKLVGISFDDGYRDTVEEALPIIASFGFKASVYIVPDSVGGRSDWEGDERAVPLASWAELRSLEGAGWEVGMHSRSHPARFDLLTGEDLERQVRGGLRSARDELNTTVETFAYPHGHYSEDVLAAVEAAGFRAGLTTAPGAVTSDTPRFELPRYEIKQRDTLPEFAFMMLTGVLIRRRETLHRLVPPAGRPNAATNRFRTTATTAPGTPPDSNQ